MRNVHLLKYEAL